MRQLEAALDAVAPYVQIVVVGSVAVVVALDDAKVESATELAAPVGDSYK